MAETAVTFGLGEMSGPGDKPVWAKCVKCAHCWPVAYFPMSMKTFAKIGKAGFRCPRCGDAKPVVAKQSDGVLNEPVSNPARNQLGGAK